MLFDCCRNLTLKLICLIEASCDNDLLPDDLMENVTEDNNKFDQEIDDWDKDLARKALGGGDADCSITGETKPGIYKLWVLFHKIITNLVCMLFHSFSMAQHAH